MTEQLKTRSQEKDELSKFLQEAEAYNTSLSTKYREATEEIAKVRAESQNATEKSRTAEEKLKNMTEFYESVRLNIKYLLVYIEFFIRKSIRLKARR